MEGLENLVQEWKARYGENNITQLDITLDNDRQETYIVRKPGRKEIEAVGQHSINKDVSKANNVLIANCVLHGDKELIESDGDVYATILEQLSFLMKKREVAIKKL